jgi:ankyrin repeat protein
LSRLRSCFLAEVQFSLQAAAINGSYKLVEFLLDGGASPNVRDHNGESVLHPGASKCSHQDWYRDYEKVTQALLDAGADPRARDHKGVSVLHAASQNEGTCDRCVEVVPLLLKAGAEGDP